MSETYQAVERERNQLRTMRLINEASLKKIVACLRRTHELLNLEDGNEHRDDAISLINAAIEEIGRLK